MTTQTTLRPGHFRKLSGCCSIAVLLLSGTLATAAEPEAVPDYDQQVRPLLRKYCVSCHNAEEPEGRLSLESFAALMQGGRRGAAIVPRDAQSSRLVRMLTGELEPVMPPEGSDAPSSAEVAVITRWIEAGARGPDGKETMVRQLQTPAITPTVAPLRPITALAYAPDGQLLAIGRFRSIELLEPGTARTLATLEGFPGKVTSVRFSPDGSQLIAASGITGLLGEASIWDVKSRQLIRRFEGHRDILYAARLSPDSKQLATAGYDRVIRLWDARTGSPQGELTGHNGAIYDLAYSPDGTVLASASADETVKIWSVTSGQRLDTLGQPLKEQYVVRFSPDGRFIAAAGADHRIRLWQFVSHKRPRINPLRIARFAHEAAITGLEFSAAGTHIITTGEDRLVKVWSFPEIQQVHAYPAQPDSMSALSVSAQGATIAIGRMDGQLTQLQFESDTIQPAGDPAQQLIPLAPMSASSLMEVADAEPNNDPEQAPLVSVPALVTGRISGVSAAGPDVDVVGFELQRGNQIVLEVKASRDKSPLDSRIAVLDQQGAPVPRVLLQAVRDSYFTFRGKDSTTIDDFRLHNWEEMELNEYLYANGEVVRLWHYPRGPDSGFQVYPGRGQRYTYFGTTPISHPLNETCYIVEPHLPGTEVPPNGLPVFQINYENDDDPRREWGSDSRLIFTAPSTGRFFVRISDARGFEGDDYRYELTVRPSSPDFAVRLDNRRLSVAPLSGTEFSVSTTRHDGFEGPISVIVEGLPDGFAATSPMIIQAGQTIAYGVITASADAATLTAEQLQQIRVRATAQIRGREVEHQVDGLQELKVTDAAKLLVRLLPDDGSQPSDAELQAGSVAAMQIAPGETISVRVRVIRNGVDGIVSFGNADSGRNLPHGVYVDNIGLNGLQVLDSQNERVFFITAADWVPETTRLFHLRAQVSGNPTSLPVQLEVVRRPSK